MILCLFLILFTGLRQVGYDYETYTNIYNEVNSLSQVLSGNINFDELHGEYGYLFLNSIIKSIFDDFTFVTLFMAIISVGLIIYSCYKYSYFVFLSIFLYITRFLFLRDMGQMRSAVACAIILYSIETIEKQRIYKFFVLISIAALFHKSALLVIPIYFLNKYNFKNKVYYICLVISFILGMVIPFKKIIVLYYSDVNNIIVHYALSKFGNDLSVLNPVALMQTFFLLLFIIYKKRIIGKVKYYKLILNMYAFSTYWLIIFSELGILAGRFANMFATVEVIIIPAVILGLSSKKEYRILGYLIVLAIGFGVFFLRLMFDDNFWNNVYIPLMKSI